jgi:hypothetical protein
MMETILKTLDGPATGIRECEDVVFTCIIS